MIHSFCGIKTYFLMIYSTSSQEYMPLMEVFVGFTALKKRKHE